MKVLVLLSYIILSMEFQKIINEYFVIILIHAHRKKIRKKAKLSQIF